MEQIVTGCVDCPFRDSAKGEYHKYCNHPDRGIGMHERIIQNGLFEAIDVEERFKANLIKKYKEDFEGRYVIEDRTFFVFDLPLNLYKDGVSVNSPEWCPLNKEPITIRKQTREDLYYKPGERYDFELCSDYGLKDDK